MKKGVKFKRFISFVASTIALLALAWGIMFGVDVWQTAKGKDPVFCQGEKTYSGQTVADSQYVEGNYKGIGYEIKMTTSFDEKGNTSEGTSITEVFLFGDRMMRFTTNNEEGVFNEVD